VLLRRLISFAKPADDLGGFFVDKQICRFGAGTFACYPRKCRAMPLS